jgi:hypothetical protein
MGALSLNSTITNSGFPLDSLLRQTIGHEKPLKRLIAEVPRRIVISTLKLLRGFNIKDRG